MSDDAKSLAVLAGFIALGLTYFVADLMGSIRRALWQIADHLGKPKPPVPPMVITTGSPSQTGLTPFVLDDGERIIVELRNPNGTMASQHTLPLAGAERVAREMLARVAKLRKDHPYV